MTWFGSFSVCLFVFFFIFFFFKLVNPLQKLESDFFAAIVLQWVTQPLYHILDSGAYSK